MKCSVAYSVGVLVFVSLILSASLGLAAPVAIAKKGDFAGPKIESDDKSILEGAEDSEGLHRLGDFGKLHLFGYGQAEYTDFRGATGNQVDMHWFTLGIGYDFTDKIKMRAEFDVEHGFKEPEIEFAYVDYLITSWANARAGAILVPMGTMNQHHEPPLFYSVERPQIDKILIPTEWQGIGAGFYGKLARGFEYELYGLSSLNAVSFNDDGTIKHSFTGSTGFDDTHSIAEAPARDFGVAGRLEYKGVPGLRLGTSAFLGNTGQGNAAIGGAFLTMLEADARYSFAGIDLESMVAFTNLTDSGNINTVQIAADPTFTDFAGRQMLGWYAQGAYHVFHHLMPNTKHDLVAFGRYEDIDTQHKMPVGFAADPANHTHNVTLGVSYMPIPNVALKADYQFNWNKANAGVDRIDVGIGYYF